MKPIKKTKTVRIIYFVPKDKKPEKKYKKAIKFGIKDLQKWYNYHTYGYTFRLNEPIVEIIKGDHESKWYNETGNKENKTLNTWNNAVSETSRKFGSKHYDDNYAWVIYIDAEGGTGAGTASIACLPEHDLLGISGLHPKETSIWRWIGGLGHELGHAFFLPHSGEKDPESIMMYGYAKYPNCHLTFSDIERLRNSEFFFQTENQNDFIYPSYLFDSYVYSDGFFVLLDDKLNWEERKYTSNVVFKFEEVSRNENYIIIKDPSRNLMIQIPKKNGVSLIGSNNNWQNWVSLKEGFSYKNWEDQKKLIDQKNSS
eukprot:Anaeramoba_ignava/a63_19.p1 GENE.a63_19~~a63_19.p1  ORF type:complete len:313 (-),score=66.47 a63_19:101-1039(-)